MHKMYYIFLCSNQEIVLLDPQDIEFSISNFDSTLSKNVFLEYVLCRHHHLHTNYVEA